MFYRVTAQMNFSTQDEANDFFHDCQVAYPKTVTINPDQLHELRSFALSQVCYHDQDPTSPCVAIAALPILNPIP